jgi:drug/metabolite transporter (DMT)-like permease
VPGARLVSADASSSSPPPATRTSSRLVAWIASTLCWLYVLRVTPLSRAYGLTSLTYVLVFLASVYAFGEQVRRVHLVGTVLIIIGLACLLSGD